MKAADILDRYGLAAFGADIDEAKANFSLAVWAKQHPRGFDFAVGHFGFKLESLLQKMEAIDDDRSSGFHLSDDEAEILDIMLTAGSRFAVRREGFTIRKV